MTCTATVQVIGLGWFACEQPAGHQGHHSVVLPSGGKWEAASWSGDHGAVRLPGTQRRPS